METLIALIVFGTLTILIMFWQILKTDSMQRTFESELASIAKEMQQLNERLITLEEDDIKFGTKINEISHRLKMLEDDFAPKASGGVAQLVAEYQELLKDMQTATKYYKARMERQVQECH